MEAAGVLIYGYAEGDALRIRTFLGKITGAPVFMTSASGKNGARIVDILDDAGENRFADEDPKIMMLLGFAEEQIHAVLGNFSTALEGIVRPIFCTLTENNQNWPLEQLLEHLEEERRYWAGKKPPGNAQKEE